MNRHVFAIVAVFGAVLGLGAAAQAPGAKQTTAALQLTSPAFQEGGRIPPQYTCDDGDSSPPLAWTDPPAGTKSFALIVDDPDAPGRTWVHWVVYNMPPTRRELSENLSRDADLDDGTRQGVTDSRRIGYNGPCPPSGTHRYVFKLYALDTVLDLPSGVGTDHLEQAMQLHTLAEAKLIGTYQRHAQ